MKLKLKETPEQIELIKAMASNNKLTAMEAQEAFAGFLGVIVAKILQQAGTAGMIYQDLPYNEDDSPSIPLELYADATNAGFIPVWSQSMAGGLPSALQAGTQELLIATYRLDSAVSFLKKYARRARLDVVSAGIQRMSQEVLIKQERNAWAVLLVALAQATTNGADHILQCGTASVLKLDDFNRLKTLIRRINQSWAGGTPESTESAGLSDLFMSPEMTEQIRGFVYNAQNTRHGFETSAGTSATSVPLPDSMREAIFRNSGYSEIYNVALHELVELGVSQKYNILFGQYAPASIAVGGGNFSATADEVIVGVDLVAGGFVRPIAKNADSGSTFTAQPDDQWVTRSEKLGFYGALEEGRAVIRGKSLCALIC